MLVCVGDTIDEEKEAEIFEVNREEVRVRVRRVDGEILDVNVDDGVTVE